MRESRHAAFQLIQQSAKQKTISVRRGCMSADVSAANRLNLLAFGPVDQPIEHGGGESTGWTGTSLPPWRLPGADGIDDRWLQA